MVLASSLPRYLRYYVRLKSSRYGAVVPAGDPFFERKFVTPYLASFLTPRQRLDIQNHLCRVLDAHFDPEGFTAKLPGGIALWRLDSGGRHLSVVLRLPQRTMLEGDLTVEVQLDGQMLHRTSFAFVPGSVLGRPEANLIFIGGSQGVYGTRELAREAARLAGEINPPNLLLIGLRALATGMGVTTIAGVAAACQSVVGRAETASLGAYDDLWRANHGEARDGYFLMPVDAPENEVIEGAHRSRTRRKRRLRQAVLQDMIKRVLPLMRAPAAVAFAAE
jgi:uncharacterized protein VirK/YbjX